MSDQQVEAIAPVYSDNVIPFRRAEPVATAEPDRLKLALAALEAALEEQRVAVAAWREAVGELHESMQGLGDSLQTYRGNLEGLAENVAELNAVAVKIQNS